jgi:hypothetical protein
VDEAEDPSPPPAGEVCPILGHMCPKFANRGRLLKLVPPDWAEKSTWRSATRSSTAFPTSGIMHSVSALIELREAAHSWLMERSQA